MSDSSSLLFESEIQRINSAIKTNLQGPVPFLSDIIRYLIDSHYTPYRSFLLLRCSELFQPDQLEAAYHTASTLEFFAYCIRAPSQHYGDESNKKANEKSG